MSDEERIEQLELEVKVLRANNKGLKDKIDEQSKEIEKLNMALMTATLKIEGLKIEAVYNDNYISNDKIKAKIEEWQKEKEFYNKDEDREWGQYNNWDWIDTIINELQSLLEKE